MESPKKHREIDGNIGIHHDYIHFFFRDLRCVILVFFYLQIIEKIILYLQIIRSHKLDTEDITFIEFSKHHPDLWIWTVFSQPIHVSRSKKRRPRQTTYWCVFTQGCWMGWEWGCWDDDITNVTTWIIPENSLRLAPVRQGINFIPLTIFKDWFYPSTVDRMSMTASAISTAEPLSYV